MYYRSFLRTVHAKLQPRHYLEIGVRTGGSLALSKARTVAIDPAFSLTAELDGNYAIFRTTSDEYFARPDPLAPTGGEPFDLTFIDGLHLFEFALRDFINAERSSRPESIIIFDDMLPRDIDEAARLRHTGPWTGDVYSVIETLVTYRPELTIIPIGTRPTGLLMVLGLDPTSTVLIDRYDEIMSRFRRADPQPVPLELTDRLTAVEPQRVLDSGIWEVFAEATGSTPDQIRAALHARLSVELGPAFSGSSAP